MRALCRNRPSFSFAVGQEVVVAVSRFHGWMLQWPLLARRPRARNPGHAATVAHYLNCIGTTVAATCTAIRLPAEASSPTAVSTAW